MDTGDVQVSAWSDVITRYDQICEEAVFGDVQFLVGPDEVPVRAHRAMLCCNPVFRALFDGGFRECAAPGTVVDIPVPHAEVEPFRMLLRALYTGRLSTQAPIVTLCKVFVLADMYQVQDLADFLAKHLSSACTSMSADDAYRCLETAHMITSLLPGKRLVLEAWPVLCRTAAADLPQRLDFWLSVSAYLLPIYPPVGFNLFACALGPAASAEGVRAQLEAHFGPGWTEHITYREAVRCLHPLRLVPVEELWPLVVAERRAETLKETVASRDIPAMLRIAHHLPGTKWAIHPAVAKYVAVAGPRLTFLDYCDGVFATTLRFAFLEDAQFLPGQRVEGAVLSPAPQATPWCCGLFKVGLRVVQCREEADGYLGVGVVADKFRPHPFKCVEPRSDRQFLAVYSRLRSWREAEGGLVRNGDGKIGSVGGDCLHSGDEVFLLLDLNNGYLWVMRNDAVVTSFRLSPGDHYSVCVFGAHSECIVDIIDAPSERSSSSLQTSE